MASKTYTAEEMRKMENAVLNECTDEENGLVYESRVIAGHVFYPDECAAMLRQAADMRERCDEVLRDNGKRDEQGRVSYCGSCICEVVNYVLRGDAGKEEK